MIVNETPPIPESIGYKKLNKLLCNAKKDLQGLKDTENENQSLELESKLEKSLEHWLSVSNELIKNIRSDKEYLSTLKEPNALLALGAMEAHINMAIQALKASQSED
ncbi:putative MATH domain [Prochlorococcus sp. SS52]|nr:putative MATH domain [Prochlorococcus marinus str. LG]KGG22061.1 putative MATH domain [Prochlorococcus marinus str. SS2]KGG24621.1 putative MATH domain [Prochlorococcus marinus str. SS35]KGG33514.1 putative MATH domain [Prochlorococcus marinus str. SS51]KGG36249.1 putative MATH domain [Prochlorococcus sp. SS52]